LIGIGKQADYAARIVLHLSTLEEGARVTAGEIAGKRLIPPAFIRRIVSRLSAAGLLTTVRGNRGGVMLARPPAEISLREVIEAMEGTIALNSCLVEGGECPLADLCPVQSSWYAATKNLSDYLHTIRFDALAAGIPAGRKGAAKKGRSSAMKRGSAGRGAPGKGDPKANRRRS
jgi:Rrf2 family protein